MSLDSPLAPKARGWRALFGWRRLRTTALCCTLVAALFSIGCFLPLSNNGRVRPGLVQLGNEPVLQVNGLGIRVRMKPAFGVGFERGAGFVQGLPYG